MSRIAFSLNGETVSPTVDDPSKTLLDWLREEKRLCGTKEGCNEGDCGACTVMVSRSESGRTVRSAVNSCILFLPQLHGTAVHTVEGVSEAGTGLHPVQSAMAEHHGSQCGFCTPGIVMSLVAAHAEGNRGHDDVLAGNLCRCTGYAPIIRAATAAESEPVPDWLAKLDLGTSAPPDANSGSKFRIPRDLDAFADWYARNGAATLVAGATDVGLWATKQLRDIAPACFIGHLEQLRTVTESAEWIEFGAAVTLSRFHRQIGRHYPGVAELIRRFGSVQVRNSATVGGNIANGSPIGDCAPALIALGSELTLRKGASRRAIALEKFFLEYGKQDLQPGEFIETVRVPKRRDCIRCYKISKRFDQDISAVCGCILIERSGDRITEARIAYGGMAGIPARARRTESALAGASWSLESIERAMKALAEDFAPISDMRASSAYRMQAARNLLLRYFREIESPRETIGILEVAP